MNIIINNRLPELKRLLSQHQALSVMGMPGGDISILLKELSLTDLGYPVYVDVFGMTTLTSLELFRYIAWTLGEKNPGQDKAEVIKSCIANLEHLSKAKGNVIVYFAGFDQLADVLDSELLQGLQALVRSNQHVKLVFGLCISTKKLIPDAYFDSGLRVFGNKYYIGGYSPAELKYWLEKYGPVGWEQIPDLDRRIGLCGGHFQLLLQLLSDQADISDTPNESTSLLFRNMYQQLLGPQRTIVRNLALGKKQPADEYLHGIGMVKENSQLFSPLFASYLTRAHQKRLPAKERRLFLLLKRNLGQTVSKQEIMDIVWQGEIVSDWAINALIYRLRKHLAFPARDYSIENHKKLGYVLIKHK